MWNASIDTVSAAKLPSPMHWGGAGGEVGKDNIRRIHHSISETCYMPQPFIPSRHDAKAFTLSSSGGTAVIMMKCLQPASA